MKKVLFTILAFFMSEYLYAQYDTIALREKSTYVDAQKLGSLLYSDDDEYCHHLVY